MLRNNKKAQGEQLPFETLLRVLIALMIFLPTIWWASGFFTTTDKGMKNYQMLLDRIDTLKDGEYGSMSIYLDSGAGIFFFNPYEDKVYHQLPDSKGSKVYGIKRPTSCSDPKSCICLCKKFPGEVNIPSEVKFCSEIICREYNNEYFLTPFRYFGGYFIQRDLIPITFGEEWLLDKKPGPSVRALYLNRYRNLIGACDMKECVDTASTMIYDEFADLKSRMQAEIEKCKNTDKSECVCGSYKSMLFSEEQTDGYRIEHFQGSQSKLEFYFGDTKYRTVLDIDGCEFDVDANKVKEKESAIATYLTMDLYVFDPGDNRQTLLYKTKDGKVCIVKKKEDSSFKLDPWTSLYVGIREGPLGILEDVSKKIPFCSTIK